MGDFLEKYIMPNVNTLAGPRGKGEWSYHRADAALEGPMLREWKRRGGKWFLHTPVPREAGQVRQMTAQSIIEYLTVKDGFALDLFDGVYADEFQHSIPQCAPYAEAVRQLKKMPEFLTKSFNP